MYIAGYCIQFSFKVTNGVRQGGILSPKLFIVYMDGLGDQLNNSNIGGKFGSGQLINHISYADDMCLLSFSSAGMQKLLNICDQYSNDHDLIYNSKKTMCMCFTPKSCKSYECKLSVNSTAAKGYDCAFCDKSTKIGTLVVLYI